MGSHDVVILMSWIKEIAIVAGIAGLMTYVSKFFWSENHMLQRLICFVAVFEYERLP